jgi:drug/metabolite transporter (DMT)-like permease
MSSAAYTVALALAAAVFFAFGNQSSKRALNYADPQTVTLYQIGVAGALYWLASPLFLEWEYFATTAALMLAVIGLFRPLISANLSTAGVRVLGPTVSSTVSASAPLLGVTLGVVLLDESLPWQAAVGTLGMVAAILVLSWRKPEQRMWPVLALLLPLGAAAIRASSHAVTKLGMEEVPSPFFAALVTYSVSFPLAFAYAYWRGYRFNARAIPLAGYAWMSNSGLMFGLAVLALNSALLSGDLVVVSPITACTPLFTLLLGRWVFGEANLDRRAIIAVGLVVPSLILIGLRGF